MRILVLSNYDMGLYKFRQELLKEAVKTNEVFFCVPEGDFVDLLRDIGGTYIPCSLLNRHGTNPIRECQLLKYYKKILRNIKPDIVFTYTIKPNVYGGMACSLLRIPYVVNITGLGTAIEKEGALQKFIILLHKIGLRKAQMVFFQNLSNKEFMLKHGVIKGEYDVLPGSGVNLDQYELLSYPNDDFVHFVFIARIMKEKGIEQYLEAAKVIRSRHINTRFHVCGFCEQDYEKILKILDKSGIIVYHGLVKDMKPIYQMASCIVHPSYYPEGISNVLLESAASGRPIITTDRPGCREVVDDGVNGYLVMQKDCIDLIEKIEAFLSLSVEDRKKMGIEGRKKVTKEFDRRIVVEKYMNEVAKLEKENAENN